MTDIKEVDELYNNGMYEFINNNFGKSAEILTEAAELDPNRKLTFASRGARTCASIAWMRLFLILTTRSSWIPITLEPITFGAWFTKRRGITPALSKIFTGRSKSIRSMGPPTRAARRFIP